MDLMNYLLKLKGLFGFLAHYCVALPSKDIDLSCLDTKQDFLKICVSKLLPCFREGAKTVLLASATFLLLVPRDKTRQISLA